MICIYIYKHAATTSAIATAIAVGTADAENIGPLHARCLHGMLCSSFSYRRGTACQYSTYSIHVYMYIYIYINKLVPQG